MYVSIYVYRRALTESFAVLAAWIQSHLPGQRTIHVMSQHQMPNSTIEASTSQSSAV